MCHDKSKIMQARVCRIWTQCKKNRNKKTKKLLKVKNRIKN